MARKGLAHPMIEIGISGRRERHLRVVELSRVVVAQANHEFFAWRRREPSVGLVDT